MSFVAPLPD